MFAHRGFFRERTLPVVWILELISNLFRSWGAETTKGDEKFKINKRAKMPMIATTRDNFFILFKDFYIINDAVRVRIYSFDDFCTNFVVVFVWLDDFLKLLK